MMKDVDDDDDDVVVVDCRMLKFLVLSFDVLYQ